MGLLILTYAPEAVGSTQSPPLAFASRLWEFLGKLHPLTVHFPIALLIVGAASEFLRRRRVRGELDIKPGAASLTCVVVGAVTAAIAATMGWSIAEGSSARSDLDWHRWLGLACAGVALVAACVGLAANAVPGPRRLAWYRFAVVLAGMLVGLAGHYGGALTYGPEYIPKAIKTLIYGKPIPKPVEAPSEPTGVSANKPVSALGEVEFGRDVFPILSRHCFSCHAGGEGLTIKSGLDLSERRGILSGGDSGEPAMVLGQGAKSWMVRLAKGEDPDRIMPPRGDRLTSEQISVLERWIDRGAPWPGQDGGVKANEPVPGPKPEGTPVASAMVHWHWAYSAPGQPQIPAVDGVDVNAPGGRIDSIVGAALRSKGLSPAPEADRGTLLRRLSLDLLGLPPTPDEIDTFVRDPDPNAYSSRVESLLSSERYGERWAAVWLDLARYADSHGYEKDGLRTMWPYRDWVIDAYNRDLPFDRFTIDQLAGDLIESPTTASLVATGFHRNTQINEEGGTDPEEFRIENIIDRTNTTASVWLGTTLACAQCHDHKYDPLAQKEYYRFFAYFDQDEKDFEIISSTEKRAAGAKVRVPRRENAAAFEAIRVRSLAAGRRAAEADRTLRAGDYASVVSRLAAEQRAGAWTRVKPVAADSGSTSSLSIDAEGVVRSSGPAPDKAVYTLEFPAGALADATGLLLEVLPGGNGHVGLSSGGNFVVQELSLSVGGLPVEFDVASSDYWQGVGKHGDEWRAMDAIDGQATSGWAVMPHTSVSHRLAVRFASALPADAGPATLKIIQGYGGSHVISSMAISVARDDVPLPVPAHVREALASPAPTPEQVDTVWSHAALLDPEVRGPRRESLQLERELASLSAADAPILRRASTPRNTKLLIKGNWSSPGESVSPAVPAVLAATCGQPETPDRLGLARWLVDPGNPLTARVQVNRIWARLWGQGLVETEDDFGTQGESPSNRDLLDYLATRFVHLGWSQKALLREIVMSRTYRASSRITPAAFEADPRNVWLARGARFRLDAEFIRDAALTSAGILTPTIGGPSVFPPQPEGIWTQIYSGDQWTPSTGPDRFRRGIYTFWRRTSHYPAFGVFDAPSRELACTRRIRTNTPLQALTTLNDPQFFEAALALARRSIDASRTDSGRVEWMFRRAVSRTPSDDETSRLVGLLSRARLGYEADPVSAGSLCRPCPIEKEGVSDIDLASLAVVANIVLNLDEALTRE